MLLTSACSCLFVSVLSLTFARNLMSFSSTRTKTMTLAESIRYLRIEGAVYAEIEILFLWCSYFYGISNPNIPLILTVLSLGTRIATSYTLASHTPLGVPAI